MPLADGEPRATVYDETGLVESCQPHTPDGDPASLVGPSVTNPGGDQSILQIDWTGQIGCDTTASITLSGAAQSYRLTGEVQSYELCRLMRVVHSIRLSMRADVPSSAVEVDDFVHLTQPNPSPREGLVPCPASDSSTSADIALVDHTDRIQSCRAQIDRGATPGDVEVASQADGLLVSWPVVLDATCSPLPTELELWDLAASAGYALRIGMVAAESGPQVLPGVICDAATGVETAVLSSIDPIAADDLYAFQAIETRNLNRSIVSHGSSAGAFDLALEAANTTYVAGEPIDDIEARLLYEGDHEFATISGGGTPHLRFDQLDGDLAFVPYGSVLLCRPRELELRRGIALSAKFERPDDIAPGDPNNAYYEQYMYDGQFRLPAGTYLITAAASFNIGSNCQGEHVALSTSIVIHVR